MNLTIFWVFSYFLYFHCQITNVVGDNDVVLSDVKANDDPEDSHEKLKKGIEARNQDETGEMDDYYKDDLDNNPGEELEGKDQNFVGDDSQNNQEEDDDDVKDMMSSESAVENLSGDKFQVGWKTTERGLNSRRRRRSRRSRRRSRR